ncbi:MAG: MFS transporter [Hyphomicrobiales bacterium]
MQSIKPLLPLFIAGGLLLGGNGVQGSLIALRGANEGFSAEFIGFLGSAYFGGFLVGCFLVPAMLRSVGHIRAFSALAAIAASATVLLVIMVDPISWLVLRFLMGVCFSCLFTTIESWLNAGTSNDGRGRILSIYRLVDLAAVTGAQYLLPIFGVDGFTLFGILAILTCLSLVPVSLGDRSKPEPPKNFRFDLRKAFAISPVACIGCITIGLTNSSFRLIGPLYATEIGFDITDVATFMSAGIIGGFVLQYPLGLLSDRVDRRLTLILATIGAVGSGLFLSYFAGDNHLLNYAGIFAFGAFALPLYSLSAAHANDHVGQSGNTADYVVIAAGLIFFFSIGAIIGPLISSILIDQFGARALFTYTSVVHASLIVIVLRRIQKRGPVEKSKRTRFVALLRTSPQIFKLAKRDKSGVDKPNEEAE